MRDQSETNELKQNTTYGEAVVQEEEMNFNLRFLLFLFLFLVFFYVSAKAKYSLIQKWRQVLLFLLFASLH